MKHWIGAAAALLAAGPAFAADVASCTLGADKRTVTISASNPYAQVMACEVNCHMDVPGGFVTVVCVKPVPAGARDFVMCTEVNKDSGTYTRVRAIDANCPDPAPPPAATKAENSGDEDDDDDARADELLKQMEKKAQDFLERQKR
jgi:hypothetical protein